MNKSILIISLTIVVILILFTFTRFIHHPSGDYEGSIIVDGLKRTYVLHIPSSYNKSKPTSLVMVLHGGGGTGRGMIKLTGFDELADKEGFIVVYPDAIGKHWNDGRNLTIYYSQRENIDDVKFLSALINHLAANYNIDMRRIYVTGISNGALMAYRLACELTNKIAAIAAVSCSMSVNIYRSCHPFSPISVLIIEGTDDPLVPWNGGEIHFGRLELGEVVSIEDTLRYWINFNNCTLEAPRTYLPDVNPYDGTRVWVEKYINRMNGVEVVLYGIEGGGHTWPGGYQYLPTWIIGRTCRDIDAKVVIWSFFKNHPKMY